MSRISAVAKGALSLQKSKSTGKRNVKCALSTQTHNVAHSYYPGLLQCFEWIIVESRLTAASVGLPSHPKLRNNGSTTSSRHAADSVRPVMLFIVCPAAHTVDICRKPKTARSKRAMLAKEPKMKENAKTAIFVRGQNTSESVRMALSELVSCKLLTLKLDLTKNYDHFDHLQRSHADDAQATRRSVLQQSESYPSF